MSYTSAKLGLPLLQAGQAQKEATHNEALILLEAMAQPIAETIGDNAPPATPAEGKCWIVGIAPTGDWTGQAGAIAIWSGGGWRFVPARDGMTVWIAAAGLSARRGAGGWTTGETRAAKLLIGGVQVVGPRQSAIAAPSGGTLADTEARTAITAVLSVLRSHGLIAV